MKTKRFSLTGLMFLFALVPGWFRPAAAQDARPAVAARHCLWRVEGRSNVVFLLGSIHLLKAEHYPLAPVIESAFSNSQTVAFEADLDKMKDPETMMKLSSMAALPEGQTLKDQLSPAVYASLSRHAADAGLPLEMLDMLKPSMVAITFEALEMLKLGFDGEHGVDQHFFALARAGGKQVVPLETFEFQMNLIMNVSKAEGEAFLKSTLDQLDQAKDSPTELVTAWQTGDAVKLEKLLNEQMRASPAIFKRLVADRNQTWMPRIEEFLRSNKNASVIVGAAHMVGPDGLVDLLRKKGFKVTQL